MGSRSKLLRGLFGANRARRTITAVTFIAASGTCSFGIVFLGSHGCGSGGLRSVTMNQMSNSPSEGSDAALSTMPRSDGGCTPRTCAEQFINCGPMGDGCGGLVQCGACTAPQTCGGSGHPSVCGISDGMACVKQSCAQLGTTCGPAGDGCGGQLDCGTCTSPQTCGGGALPGVCGGVPGSAAAFPLSSSANGRYLVDKAGFPFRIQGEASWDAHINLNLDNLRTYLSDRQSKGINALFTYVANSVAYYAGSSAPWAVQLGGKAAATAALPFTQNQSGGAWNGDPNFTNHDANFAYPNDAYFAWVGQFVDEAASRGMVVLLAPMYLGYGLGKTDGWYQTLTNSSNTQSICYAFGQYLATGHGAFTGFKDRPNIIWVEGGDTTPPNGSEGALRALQILKGMKANGDTHLHTAHWQHDYLANDQTDFAPFLGAYSAYSHGSYGSPPVLGPTYAETRALYGTAQVRPTWLIETTYWGDDGASRAQLRYFGWASALSAVGGTTIGFSPFWGFAVSPDGTGTTSITGTTAWMGNTVYVVNQYVSHSGSWYRATTSGQSGSTGPSGTGSRISDGQVTWGYVAPATWNALLNEPPIVDFQRMGSFLNGIAWQDLVPSGLGGTQPLVSAGVGSYASWSDTNPEMGGMDWIASAASSNGSLLVAYVPDAHVGPFSVSMSALRSSARARWFDPTNGAYTADPAGTGYVVANGGVHQFTSPGANASSAKDWVLVLDVDRAQDH